MERKPYKQEKNTLHCCHTIRYVDISMITFETIKYMTDFAATQNITKTHKCNTHRQMQMNDRQMQMYLHADLTSALDAMFQHSVCTRLNSQAKGQITQTSC
jgi:hypothetical protein